MKKQIKFLCLLLWMMIIFYMSHQTGTSSSGMSGKLFSFVTFLFPVLKAYKVVITLCIRKLAHVFEFFVLACLSYSYAQEISYPKSKLFTFLICFFNAAFDEVHQAFIPGRCMAFTDVLIDMIGFLLLLGFLEIKKFMERRKISRKEQVCVL